jgi:hypothetical protein
MNYSGYMDKKILLIIVFAISLIEKTNSQDFWEQLYFPDTATIRCIITNNQGHIFIGTGNSQETGGVYRSTDNAQNWDLVLDIGSFGVLSLEINSEGIIYAGTNQGFHGLYVSYNNGQSWDDINLPPPSYGNVIKILCIGQDTIYVSTWETEGSFITYSFDSGYTWEYSYVTDHPNEYVSDIDITSTGEIFVSVSGFFWDQGGVYKSGDNGFSWEYVGLFNHQVITLEINSTNDVFTGDWWVMNNDTPGIYALYTGTNTFDLIFDAYHATDIVIDANDHIYAAANEGVVYSYDDGQTFEQIEDELSATIEFLYIGSDGHIYGIRFNRLIKSIYPIITGTNENYNKGMNELVKAYPNPFNETTQIWFKLENESSVMINIYDYTGKRIKSMDQGTMEKGTHWVEFCSDGLIAGIYFYSLEVNGIKTATKKMILMK